MARDVIRANWTDIIEPFKADPTEFANRLLKDGLISKPAQETAVDRFTGRSGKERATELMSSVEVAVKIEGNRFKTLCEIVRSIGDSVVANKLVSAYCEQKKVNTK